MNTEDLYAELLLERFGPIPWKERKRLPSLPPRRHWRTVVRVAEPDEVTAARRKVLDELPWREEAA